MWGAGPLRNRSLTMPVRRCRHEKSFENCDGLLSAQKKSVWELTGPCRVLSTALPPADVAYGCELGHVLELVEGLLTKGAGLDGVSFFTHELNEDGPFGRWLDELCVRGGDKLAACKGPVEASARLEEAAASLQAEGARSKRYELSKADFVAVAELWKDAADKEPKPDEAFASLATTLADGIRARAEAFTMDLLLDEHGGAGWREMEMICGTRLHVEEAARSASFVLDRVCAVAFAGLLEGGQTIPTGVSVKEAAEEVARELSNRRAPLELRTRCGSKLHARKNFVAMLAMPAGSTYQLNLDNVVGAAQHHELLRVFMAGASAAEVWNSLDTLATKLQVGSSGPSLAVLRVLVQALKKKAARLEDATGDTLMERTMSALELIGKSGDLSHGRERAESTELSERDDGGKPAATVGYARCFRQKLQDKIDGREFIEKAKAVEQALDELEKQGDAEGSHPHDLLRMIFELREPIFIHALFGLVDMVKDVPATERIAALLRHHGPWFLGFLGLQLLMPEAMAADDVDDGQYPELKELWLKVSTGDMDINLEEHWLNAVTRFYGDEPASVAEGERFKDQMALARLQRSCSGADGLYGLMGWDAEPSFGTAIAAAMDYLSEATTVTLAVRKQRVHEYLTGICKERATLVKRAFKVLDPTAPWGGSFIIAASPAQLAFDAHRRRAGRTFRLHRDLQEMGVKLSADGESRLALVDEGGEQVAAPGVDRAGGGGGGKKAPLPDDRTTEEIRAKKQAEKKKAKAEEKDALEAGKIGIFGDRIEEDESADRLRVKNAEGKVIQTYPLQKFKEALPKGGCVGAHATRAFLYWRFCTCDRTKVSAEEAERHSTTKGGAHADVVKWRAKWLPLLLLAGAQAGSGMMVSPSALPVDLPTVKVQEAASRHVFVPMMRKQEQLLVGVPPCCPDKMFGEDRIRRGRELDFEQAGRWSTALFTSDVHAFYLFETEDEPATVVSTAIATEEGQLKAGVQLEWVTLRQIGDRAAAGGPSGTSQQYRLAAIATARVETFSKPTKALPDGVITGAMKERLVQPQQALGAAAADERRQISWSDVKESTERAMRRVIKGLEDALTWAGLSPERKEDIAAWLQVARQPVQLDEYEEGLREVCYDARDERLAMLPLPNGTKRVATAPMGPLPDPPPKNAIPAHAKDWDDVLKPEAYAAAVAAQKKCYDSLCKMARSVATGEPAPKDDAVFFACGTDCCQDWARIVCEQGQVIVKGEHGLELLDQSRPAPFTMNPEYWKQILADSPDHALRDIMTWRGVSFYADELERQLVICGPQPDLVHGFASVHQSAKKMTMPGFFRMSEVPAGQVGKRLHINCFPGRYQKITCVPRKLSAEWRLCVNNSFPLDSPPRFTTIGRKACVRSVNSASKTKPSKAALKAARAALVMKGGSSSIVSMEKTARAQEAAEAKVPEAVAAEIERQHGVNPNKRAGEPGGPVIPAELKAYFYEVMVAICYYAYVGTLIDAYPVVFGDDLWKMFHQFALAYFQQWTCGQMLLHPDDVAALMDGKLPHDVELRLASFLEECMSMGTTPSSNIGQRALTEHCRNVEKQSVPAVADQVAQLRAKYPAFDEHLKRREELSRQTGEDETRMLWCRPYTDDQAAVTLDCFLPSMVVVWGNETGKSGLKRSEAYKRTIGVQMDYLGGRVLTTGLLAAVPKPKVMRMVSSLQDAIHGVLTVKLFYELGGLVQHVVYILALPKYVLYDFYHGIDKLRRDTGSEPDENAKVPATKTAVKAYRRVKQAALARGGSSLLSAVIEMAPPSGAVRWRVHCDAALKGTGDPAICANLYEMVTRIKLRPSFRRWPIVALEFMGEGPLPLLSFGGELEAVTEGGAAWVVLPCDSLVAPRVMTGAARRSPLLRFMHELLMKLPIFKKLERYLVCSHEFGVGNPLTDAGSRGKDSVMQEVARSLGLRPREVEPPQTALEYMETVDRYLDELIARGEYVLNADGVAGLYSTSVSLGVAAQSVAEPHMSMAQLGMAAASQLKEPSERMGDRAVNSWAEAGRWLVLNELRRWVSSRSMHGTSVFHRRRASFVGAREPFAQPVVPSPCCGTLGGRGVTCCVCEGNKCSRCYTPFAASTGMVECECRVRRVKVKSTRRTGGGWKLILVAAAVMPAGGVNMQLFSRAAERERLARAFAAAEELESEAAEQQRGFAWQVEQAEQAAAEAAAPRPHVAMDGSAVWPPTSEGATDVSGDDAGGVIATPKMADDVCEWLRMALDAAANGQVDDITLNHLLLAMNHRHIRRSTQAAARAALRVLTGSADQATARAAEGASARSMARWMNALKDLMEDCNVVVARALPVAAASTIDARETTQSLLRMHGSSDGASCPHAQPNSAGGGSIGSELMALSNFILDLVAFVLVASMTLVLGAALHAPRGGTSAKKIAILALMVVGAAEAAPARPVLGRPSPVPAPFRPVRGVASPNPGATPPASAPLLPRRVPRAAAATLAAARSARPATPIPPRPAVQRVYPASSRASAVAPPRRPFSAVRTDDKGVDREAGIAGWAEALVQDNSHLAIMPGRGEQLEGLLNELGEYLELAYAESTNRTDKSHLKAWKEACAELGTSPWRTDMAANMGTDPVGYRRELLVPALAFLKMYAKMKPRSKRDPAPNPRSCLLKLYAVGREHKKRGFTMAPFTLAVKVMAGMLHHYVITHGTDSLMPHRKNPLTNEMIQAMLDVPDGTRSVGKGPRMRVDWQSDFWLGVCATISTLAETGMRKADVSKATATTPFKRGRLTLASVRWQIGGMRTAAPTREQLDALGGDDEDGCWLVYGAMKNDAYGEHFGAKPAWLPFRAGAKRNACRSIAALEARAARAGITAASRAATPLFGPAAGTEWHHAQLEAVFDFLLEHGCKLGKLERAAYSLHSFRIFLACALYAAGCPNDKICAILRWRSEDALLIYARMNDPERTAWVDKAMTQQVISTTTAHLPRIDPDDYVASLLEAVRGGDLTAAATSADAGEVDEDELEEAVNDDGAARSDETARRAARAIMAAVGAADGGGGALLPPTTPEGTGGGTPVAPSEPHKDPHKAMLKHKNRALAQMARRVAQDMKAAAPSEQDAAM